MGRWPGIPPIFCAFYAAWRLTWYNRLREITRMFVLDILQTYLTVLLSVSAGLLLALWLAVVVWAYRDFRSRSRSRFVGFLVALVVALLPIVGLAIYLLLRPRETLGQAYDRALEQEALLQQIEDRPVCPTCARPTERAWFLCPTCHTHLRQPCPTCRSPLELHWDICPYCGYLFESEPAPAADEVAAEAPLQVEEALEG